MLKKWLVLFEAVLVLGACQSVPRPGSGILTRREMVRHQAPRPLVSKRVVRVTNGWTEEVIDWIPSNEMHKIHWMGLSLVEGKPLYQVRDDQGKLGHYLVWRGHGWGIWKYLLWEGLFEGLPYYHVRSDIRKPSQPSDKLIWGFAESETFNLFCTDTSTDERPLRCASRGKKWYVLRGVRDKNKKPGFWVSQPYDHLTIPYLEAGRPLFAGQRQGQWFLVWGKTEQLVSRVEDIDLVRLEKGKLAYAFKRANQWFVKTESKQYGPYTEVRDLCFASGKPLFEVKRQGIGWSVVWGEFEGKSYQNLINPCPSRPGVVQQPLLIAAGRLFYVADRAGKQLVVWGEEEGREYDRIRWPDWPDSPIVSGQPLYLAERDDWGYVVWGKTEYYCGGTFGKGCRVKFLNGKPFFSIFQDGAWFVVFGEERWGPYFQAKELSVWDPPDRAVFGGRPLVVAKTEQRYWVVTWEGKDTHLRFLIREYSSDEDGRPTHQDCENLAGAEGAYVWQTILQGQRLAVTSEGDKFFLIRGKEKQGPFDCLSPIVIPPTGNVLTLVPDGDRVLLVGESEGKQFVFWRMQKGRSYDLVSQVVLLAGKPHYLGYRDGHWFVIWGEEERGPYDRIKWIGEAGEKPFYRAWRGQDIFIVWGEKISDPIYWKWSGVDFRLADGSPVHRRRLEGGYSDTWWEEKDVVVVGELESPEYDQVFSLHFEGDKLVFGAMRGQEFYRVTRQLTTKQLPVTTVE